MAEYIEREAAIEAIMSEPPDARYPHWYADKIKAIPSADVAPVRHGRWVKSNYHGLLCCSECKDVYIDKTWLGGGKWNYCPNCGAIMDGKQ